MDFFSRRYEQHLKCKGSFKDLLWKYKIFQAQRHRLNSFLGPELQCLLKVKEDKLSIDIST